MTAILDSMPLAQLFEEAAKTATGHTVLYDSKTGQFCLWGEVGRMVGIPLALLDGKRDFDEASIDSHNLPFLQQAYNLRHCRGSRQWDWGDKQEALRIAVEDSKDVTVEIFRSLMRKSGLLE
jgi:hypothetical protein